MTALTPAEMARARYGEVFGGTPITDARIEAVVRIPGFAQAWREARRHLALQAKVSDAA
jgi:hypothetical protein